MSQNRPITAIDTDCSAPHAYNFNIIDREILGFILEMTFTGSGKSLAADVPVSDPENPDSKIKAVAVLDYIKWPGGPTDPIIFRGRLSPANQGVLRECVSSLNGGSDVEVSWTVKSYDHPTKKYFERFHSDKKKLKFVITQGSEVAIEEKPDTEIKQPVNYQFYISLTPKSEGGDQSVCCATSAQHKFSRQIGLPVG